LLSSRGHLRCVSCEDRLALEKALDDLDFGVVLNRKETGGTGRLSRDEKIRQALIVWNGATPAINTPADRYLSHRGLDQLATSPALRWRLDVPHPNPEVRVRIPAMVALVVDVYGAPTAIQRTYLSRSGEKADVDPVRAAKGPLWGGAVRLHDFIDGGLLVVGEGIESSASAGRLMDLPAWAAVSAGNLAKGLLLPLAVKQIIIAADPDEQGEQAARLAALRWSREGRAVRIARPNGDGDFNDLLRALDTK
jgi:putative DNA primase/helicase